MLDFEQWAIAQWTWKASGDKVVDWIWPPTLFGGCLFYFLDIQMKFVIFSPIFWHLDKVDKTFIPSSYEEY